MQRHASWRILVIAAMVVISSGSKVHVVFTGTPRNNQVRVDARLIPPAHG